MDTSETYIKMCEKADEIQRFKRYDPMSWYYHTMLGNNEVVEGRNMVSVALCIWLPRQDQLQEMMNKDVPFLLIDFHIFTSPISYCEHGVREAGYYNPSPCEKCREEYWAIHKAFTSMEQLWLSFVMKEKYNKVWDGENWVEINVAGRTRRNLYGQNG